MELLSGSFLSDVEKNVCKISLGLEKLSFVNLEEQGGSGRDTFSSGPTKSG